MAKTFQVVGEVRVGLLETLGNRIILYHMTVHLFTEGPFPYGMASSRRILCYARGLKAAGSKVVVESCHRSVETGNDDGLPAKGQFRGVTYKYIAGKYKRHGKLWRGLDWYVIDALKSSFFAFRSLRVGDISFIYAESLFLQLLLLLASKIKGARVVREVCEHPLAMGNASSKSFRLGCWLEMHFLFRFYDGFVVISKSLDKLATKYKSQRASTIIVPIMVERPQDLLPSDQHSPYSVPYIIHTGTMNEQKDSISKIMKAFARFKCETHSSCKLVFTGPDATSQSSYLPLINKLEVGTDIELLGLVSDERLACLQRFAAMTIIYKSDNLQTRNCFPTKLGEMLIREVPVITTTVGDASLYLKNGESAYIFEPDNEDELLNYMKQVLDNPVRAREIGERGKLVAQKCFSPIAQGAKLSAFFQMLLAKG